MENFLLNYKSNKNHRNYFEYSYSPNVQRNYEIYLVSNQPVDAIFYFSYEEYNDFIRKIIGDFNLLEFTREYTNNIFMRQKYNKKISECVLQLLKDKLQLYEVAEIFKISSYYLIDDEHDIERKLINYVDTMSTDNNIVIVVKFSYFQKSFISRLIMH